MFAGNQLDGQLTAWATQHVGHARRHQVDGYAIWTFDGRISSAQLDVAGVF
ncbi:MAG: hypothetical protein ACRDXE_01720 [Acidimicrobiales bacterium]